ncbi:hypothetical protein RB601_002380 [Gaeumannomyces tritici]
MDILPAFLKGVREHVVAGDGETLSQWLLAEPDSPPVYFALGQELRRRYPKAGSALRTLIEKSLPEDDEPPESGNTPWGGFHAFVHEFLVYWRDVNFGDLMDVHERLLALSTACVSALKHPGQGSLMVQTSVSYAQSMVKLVAVLKSRPDLTTAAGGKSAGDEEEVRTFVDDVFDLINGIFNNCALDRAPLQPGNKKSVVYLVGAMAFRLLLVTGKPLTAWTLITGAERAPALSLFPAAQRVTWLYYLGVVMFQNDHYPRAVSALSSAYRQLPPSLTKQRRLVLTHLIPANILSGRLPSAELLARPEARQLAPVFRPLVAAIRKGNFVAFQHAIAARQDWLLERGLLFPLMYRARPLLWRSLTRRVFVLTYVPDADTGGSSRKAVTLDINAVHVAATYQQRLLEGYVPTAPHRGSGSSHFGGGGANPLLMRALANNTPQPPPGTTLVPGPGAGAGGRRRRLRAHEGLLWGNLPAAYEHVEEAVMGLVAQGLVNGYVSHSARKLAIQGARAAGDAGPALAGWPANVADIIAARIEESGVDTEWVPGWVK